MGRRRQRQFALLMALTLVAALAEVVSLGAVLPFLAVLVAPERVFNYPLVAQVSRALNMTSAEQLVLPLTLAFVAAAIASGLIRIAQLWANMRFTFASGADISIEVYRRTLYQSYGVQVARGSAEVISGITQKAGSVVLGILMPLMT
jgi:ATP-binding cassette subfamily B protein